MKLSAAIFIIVAAATALGQDNSCFPHCLQCNGVVIEGGSKRIVGSIEFRPLTGEEELTNKVLNVPGTNLQVHASVFFTDEALASNAGADSIELALAIAPRGRSRKRLVNNAVAETTLSTLDTLRVAAPFTAGRKMFVAALKCQSPKKVQEK